MSKHKLYQNASALLADLQGKGFVVSAPINVEEIAAMLNIHIVNDSSLELKDIIGEILFDDGNPIIKINPHQNSYFSRKRFTIAHEIGHFCLHSAESREGFSDSRKTMSRSDSYWDKYESEANNFAAQLLMPKQIVISEGSKILKEYKNNNQADGMPVSSFIEKLSTVLQVSTKAMEYRLKKLGIV